MKNFLKHTRFKLILLIIQSLLSFVSIRRKVKGPNIIFIHIPKTAGTSIFKALNNEMGMQLLKKTSQFLNFPNKGAVTFGHISYLNLLALGVINQRFHNNAYKFCFVRNPYRRVVSLFNYLKDIKAIDINISFEKFLDNIYLKRPPIGIYNRLGLSQTNPQVDWILDENGNFLVDEVFKIEDLKFFTDVFKKKFKVNLDIKQFNESKKHITIEYILKNKTIINKIEKIYARDFDLLNYKRLSD